MKNNQKIEAIRELLKYDKEKPETIKQVLKIIEYQEKKDLNDSLRNWLALFVSITALIISIFYNQKLVNDKKFQINQSNQVINKSRPLDFLTTFETNKGKIYILISQEFVSFQPFDISDDAFKQFSIKKDKYPKLFQQGIAQWSLISAEKQETEKEILVKLTNKQPSHGAYAPVYSLIVNPITGEIKENIK
jgi:hypothetical protein